MILSDNPLYRELILNECHTLVLKIWDSVRGIVGMSTNPRIPKRDHTAQLQYRWHEIDINITKKTIEIFKNSNIIFRDADKSEKRIEIDIDSTINNFFGKLVENWFRLRIEDGKELATAQEIMAYLLS